MIDSKYKVIIGGEDFSDIIDMDSWGWTVISISAESQTGQDTKGKFHIPVRGELVQLAFSLIEYVKTDRITSLVNRLKIGEKGQREVEVTYDDPLFGLLTHNFYCTNIPWIKERLPNPPYDYVSNVSIQLASTSFVRKRVVEETLGYTPKFNSDPMYTFKLNGKEFNDIVDLKGFKGQSIEQSLESLTGRSLSGDMELPILGSRVQNEINCIEYIEEKRFRQLGKELGFGRTGEREHTSTYVDPVFGSKTQTYYCTTISGSRQKLPDYPYHYIKDVKFQQAMKYTI